MLSSRATLCLGWFAHGRRTLPACLPACLSACLSVPTRSAPSRFALPPLSVRSSPRERAAPWRQFVWCGLGRPVPCTAAAAAARTHRELARLPVALSSTTFTLVAEKREGGREGKGNRTRSRHNRRSIAAVWPERVCLCWRATLSRLHKFDAALPRLPHLSLSLSRSHQSHNSHTHARM